MGPIVPFAALLAHQGGWDEVALVGGPILLIIGLLAIVKRRVDAQAAHQRAARTTDRDAD
ncbi:MAG TPA: hypothetical protein VLA10_07690 [Ilumatobacter sp.]|nr:hypothetical protein [Ilumatobacter sp.]